MRMNMPKKQHKFLDDLEQRQASKNLSLVVTKQRHREIAKDMSKFIGKLK